MLGPSLSGQFAALAGVGATGGTFSGAVTFGSTTAFTGIATFSAVTYFADGTSSAPGVAFAGAHGTGLYRSSLTMGLAVAGVKGLEFTSDGTRSTWSQFPVNSVTKLAASHTLDETDNGKTFCVADNVADYTITVPTTLPEGFEFTVYCNSTAKKIIVQMSGTERIRNGTGWTGAGGTGYFDGAGGANTGYSAVIKKLDSAGFAFTFWGVTAGIGALTLT